MSSTPTPSNLIEMRNTLVQMRAEASAYEAEVLAVERVRLSTLHEEVGLPSLAVLIERLQDIARANKKHAEISAETVALVRAAIEAKLPREEVCAKFGLTPRVYGGIKGSMPKPKRAGT